MKKIISAILAVLTVFLLVQPVNAFADVIWEPNDSFFQAHSSEAYRAECTYVANSPAGYVLVCESPDKVGKNPKVLTNGEKAFAHFTVNYKGSNWGFYEVYDTNADQYVSGWFNLDECYKVFDCNDFISANGDKLINEEKVINFGENYVMWVYPGAETCNKLFECNDVHSFTQYIDDEGNEWYFFDYVMGMRNFWVNASAPEKTECKKYEVPEIAVIYPAKQPTASEIENDGAVKTSTDENNMTILWIVVGVLVLAAGASAIIIAKKINRK